MSDYGNLVGDLSAELGIDAPVPLPRSPEDLRGRVEDMTVQLGRLNTRVTECLLESDTASRAVGSAKKEFTGAIADVSEAIQGLTKTAAATAAEVEGAQSAIASLEEMGASQESRVALLEAKMNRVGEFMSEQTAAVDRLRRQRFTVTHILLGAIAIAVCFNAFTEFAAKLDHEGRLRRIESAQVEGW